MSRLSIIIICTLAMLPTTAVAQPAPPDHGMVLATCMEVAPGKLSDTTKLSDTKNYVFRGRVISLDKERTVSLCFDTDTMRVAGAWVGKPVAYTADKNMGPAVDGKMLFATKPGPGWAKDGKWDDPRVGGEGPLPHDWTHYRGLYMHGDKVVLSYTVGDCAILEMPGVAQVGEIVTVTRTIEIGPSAKSHYLLVCEEPWKRLLRSRVLVPGFAGGNLTVTEIERAADRLVVAVIGGAPAALGFFGGNRVYVHVPPRQLPVRFRVVVASVPLLNTLDAWATAQGGDLDDLQRLTKGGAPRWKQTIETKGVVAPAGKFPYVVDDIDLPTSNPWHTPIRPSGLDFFPDGRAAICTWDGDVWIVSGLDDKLDKVRWKRFASGLQQPLGLKIIGGFIYTAGRDQITKLHDLNGDGEADFYENFNNDAPLTLQRHEFVMDLQTDAQGNLYYGRSGHYLAARNGGNCCIYKVSPDGEKLEVFATGLREPNGLSIGPDGTMIVGDNEGNGVPQTPLYRLERGAFYGYSPSKSAELGVKGARWEYSRTPILWLPKNVDRSAGSQVWVPDDRFGPLKGQLLHTSYGHCALYNVLLDCKAEPWQGAVWKFPLGFTSGVMRPRFNPKDGQLYLCGLRGWDTNAVKDGQFCRVRYTGKPLPIPVGFEVAHSSLKVTFSGPLDRAAAEDDENWTGDWSNPIVKTGTPTKAKQELAIAAVQLSLDRQTVTVSVDRLQPASNFTLQYRMKSADGAPVTGALHGTIHRVP